MATIIASAGRFACAVAGALIAVGAAASIDAGSADTGSAPVDGNPSAAGYSLSYDPSRWTQEFSVFQVAIADPLGSMDFGFATSTDPRLKPLTRLDSSWTLASPFGAMPLRLGDGVSSANLWNTPTRMGGIQIGTYTAQAPAVVAPPSVVADPYETPGPVDLAKPRLLDHAFGVMPFDQPGLTPAGQGQFSLESGRVRENFELRSDDYGSWITSGSYRYGISGGTTIDGQVAQVAGQQTYLGLGVLEGLGPSGLLSARLANSRDQDVSGWRAQIDADYSHDRFSFAIRSHVQSAAYQDVGDASVIQPLRQRTLASAGMDLGAMGRVSLASVTQIYQDDSRRDLVAVSHAMPIVGGGVVSTAAAYSPGQAGSSALWLSFAYPFDHLFTPAQRISSAVDLGLDRTIADVFGPVRISATGPGQAVPGQAAPGQVR